MIQTIDSFNANFIQATRDYINVTCQVPLTIVHPTFRPLMQQLSLD